MAPPLSRRSESVDGDTRLLEADDYLARLRRLEEDAVILLDGLVSAKDAISEDSMGDSVKSSIPSSPTN
jgi:hypothetical protein